MKLYQFQHFNNNAIKTPLKNCYSTWSSNSKSQGGQPNKFKNNCLDA